MTGALIAGMMMGFLMGMIFGIFVANWAFYENIKRSGCHHTRPNKRIVGHIEKRIFDWKELGTGEK